jgi:Ion transport protein
VVVVKHANRFRNFLLDLQRKAKFEIFFLVMIILNTIALLVKWTGEPKSVTNTTTMINYVFLALFTLEMATKLIALGPIYFNDRWNIFDLLVILLSYACIALAETTPFNFGPQATLIRSIKIMKIFKYFKRTRNLKIMFQTFIHTLPALGSIGGLLALLVYVYAVLGVSLFAEVKRLDPYDDVQNFQSFTAAFLILIKITTGDGWAELMANLSKQNYILFQCIEDPSY